MKNLKNCGMAFVLWVVFIVFVLSLTSCASKCERSRRYWSRHRVVQVTHDTIPSYFYANNQIVMVERNH
jgi:uncharacterized membrane protein